ncbi:hypothetical protein H2200_010612 [Cladophialophora chaetospira]|uniref:Integral membrane protein n=1 Tax=Cladophialophora chaetospira TaxID=386627 RepID=A0AA38X206_9EURO|nr:hypothetical protein H2200_010612 [Cladophialophora chaetospira]
MSSTSNGQRSTADSLLPRRHPLQRHPSPSRSLSFILHITGLASFSYSYNWLLTHPNHINSAYGWHFQYLTIIGLTLATTTFLLGLFADLTLSPRLFRAKNVLSMCSAPMEVLVSLLYWGLRVIDPELVVPKELELPLPPDLGFHAAPSALLLVDLLFFSPPWTIAFLPSLALSTGIALAYWFWIELCYSYNGFYPYPLFALLDTTQRMELFGGSAVVMAGVTVVLKWLYGRVNGVVGPRGGMERPGRVKG